MSDQLPAVYRPGGEIVDPSAVINFLATSDEHLSLNRELVAARDRAIRNVLSEHDTTDIQGREVPVKSGYCKLARFFHLDTYGLGADGAWEKLEFEDIPHYVATSSARAVAPWGQIVERSRTCSTREEKFGRIENGRQVHNFKARASAENDCRGIAETRAINACIDAIIALGKLDDIQTASQAEAEDERHQESDRKHMERRVLQAQADWKEILHELGVEFDVEAALYRSSDQLPDTEELFGLKHYATLLDWYKRRGPALFDGAAKWLADQETEADLPKCGLCEKPIGPDDELDETGKMHADCGVDDESGLGETSAELSRDDPARDEPEFAKSLRDDPMGEKEPAAKKPGEPSDTERRAVAIKRADDICKELVEDGDYFRRRVNTALGRKRRVVVELLTIDPGTLEEVVFELEKELADRRP